METQPPFGISQFVIRNQATRPTEPDGAALAQRACLRVRPRIVQALAQQVEEPLLRHRRGDQGALAEIAAHDHERLQIGGGLDPLGDRRAAEAVREVDRGLADRGIGGVARAVLHEAAVELDLDKREIAQAGERGIAGAEIVDCDLDTA